MSPALIKSLADRVSDQSREYAEASARIRSRTLNSFYVNPFAMLGTMLGLPQQATVETAPRPAQPKRGAGPRAIRTPDPKRPPRGSADRSKFA